MQVINKILVIVVSAFLLSFGSISASALEKCEYENPNNVLAPSGDITKDDICNTPYMDSYRNLYYYSGPKAFCGDNKAAFCAKVESELKGKPAKEIVNKDSRWQPAGKQYWYQAMTYCGLDANATLAQYCENYMTDPSYPITTFELYCKPEQIAAYADKKCTKEYTGREYSTSDQSDGAQFCVRNYKGKLPPKLLQQNKGAKANKPKAETWRACRPEMRAEDVKKGSAKLTVEPSSTNSNSGSSSSNSSSSNNSSSNTKAPENTTPQAPAGVSDALNKAKKLKDVFGF